MKKSVIIAAATALVVGAGGVGAFVYANRDIGTSKINATHLSLGEKYLAEMDYNKAMAELEQVIAVEPNNAEAYLQLARAYEYIGDIDSVRDALEKGYENTSSPVIKRELDGLDNAGGFVEVGETSAESYVEIAGRLFPTNIREIILRNCGVTSDDLEKLSQFPQLERLDVSGNGLTDISAVANIPSLKKFYAAYNEISDISALSGLDNLEYVGLRGNKITNADSLISREGIKYLHLTDNQIAIVGEVGGDIMLLYLSGNQIDVTINGASLLYCDIN